MVETWYVLADGSYADPNDCVIDGGVLKHRDGREVAMRAAPVVPHTRSMYAADLAAYRTREMKAEPPADEPARAKRAYRTREMKA